MAAPCLSCEYQHQTKTVSPCKDCEKKGLYAKSQGMYEMELRAWKDEIGRPVKTPPKTERGRPKVWNDYRKETITLYFGPAELSVFKQFSEFMADKPRGMSGQIVQWMREGLERETR